MSVEVDQINTNFFSNKNKLKKQKKSSDESVPKISIEINATG